MRHWTAQMPERYKNIDNPKIKWQPERLSFRQGLEEVPYMAFVIYGVILVALLVLEVIALRVLPSTIAVSQLFISGMFDISDSQGPQTFLSELVLISVAIADKIS